MRKITRICRDNISAEIFQPSAFSMAGGIFFGGFSNGDNEVSTPMRGHNSYGGGI